MFSLAVCFINVIFKEDLSFTLDELEDLVSKAPAKRGKHCLANISNFACQACLPVWPPRQALPDKNILLVNVFETFQKHFLFVTSKNVSQARVCVVAKPTNIVLDKQNFKCLPNNVCPFGRGLRQPRGRL